jgi:hypothetical protein
MYVKKVNLSLCVKDLYVGGDNIKMDIWAIGWCGTDWIHLAYDKD